MFTFFKKKKPEVSDQKIEEILETEQASLSQEILNTPVDLEEKQKNTSEQSKGLNTEDYDDVTDSLHAEISSSDQPLETKKLSFTQRLRHGLSRTSRQLSTKLGGMLGLRKIDEEFMEELETILLMADCGIEATSFLMNILRQRWKKEGLETVEQLKLVLIAELEKILQVLQQPLEINQTQPFVIMLVGVNGAGKTTSIGKLAKAFQQQGKKVLLAAGDTFRAAAAEQLFEWGQRNDVTVVSQEKGDSAAVIFDAVTSAQARKIDVVLADTAGRLPTQQNLMDEIAKVKRVLGKAMQGAPHEVLLVLDANIGQNALTQLKAFDERVGVTGLVLTKLDGSAKGGVVVAIAQQMPKPLRYIGVGEGIDDLQPFNAHQFVEALFSNTTD